MSLRCYDEVQREFRARGEGLYDYQVEAARRIVEEMGGSGILADEVGLGKTIEAGLILRELMARKECASVLILVPASLVSQWQSEMAEKFGLSFVVNPRGALWHTCPRIIASLDRAKRSPTRQQLLERSFDLVMVDEAHKLKNRNTQNHELVASLRCRRLLLLSATPLQNDLTELYSLVELVQPQLFGNYRNFQRDFLLDKRTPKDAAGLRTVLNRVMVRHRRQELAVHFPERQVALLPIDLSHEEQALYAHVTALVREEYWRCAGGRGTILPLITLQREVCSSPQALLATLDEDTWLARQYGYLRTLVEHIVEQSKARALENLLGQVAEKMLIFTEYRATQEYLAGRLRACGVDVVLFHGGLSAPDKAAAVRRFAGQGRVMLSTESGGQGLNLQFCRHIVNYDLPWNPMRVEQRIGRVHRLGQEQPVCIYNLFARGTVEEHILRLLNEKINLFRQVIGELDVIIRHLERKRSFESTILQIVLGARDEQEMRHRFDQLGEQLAQVAHRVQSYEEVAVLS